MKLPRWFQVGLAMFAIASLTLSASSPPDVSLASTVGRPALPSMQGEPSPSGPIARIAITSSGFVPQVMTTTAGSTVVWTNQDAQAHRVASGPSTHRVYLPALMTGFDPGLAASAHGSGYQADPKPPGTVLGSSLEGGARQPLAGSAHSAVALSASAAGSSWDSGLLSQGAQFSLTLTAIGTYSYQCALHPAMAGTIVVVSPTTTAVVSPAAGGSLTSPDGSTSVTFDLLARPILPSIARPVCEP